MIPSSVREINDSGKSISADFIPFPGKISLTYLSVVEMVSVVVTPIKERKNLRQNWQDNFKPLILPSPQN